MKDFKTCVDELSYLIESSSLVNDYKRTQLANAMLYLVYCIAYTHADHEECNVIDNLIHSVKITLRELEKMRKENRMGG